VSAGVAGAELTMPAGSLKQIERTSTADTAYRAIRASMLYGHFEPGRQLVEARLAEALGVSRGPVREALGRLRDEGLVEEILHRGMFVREFTVSDVVDIYNLRVGVESVAIRLATRRRADTAILRKLQHEMEAAALAHDVGLVTERELGFHRQLCVASENQYVLSTFTALSGQIQMAVAMDNAAYRDLGDVPREHGPLIEAIEAGDEDLAAKRITEHILGTIDTVLERRAGDDRAREARARLLRPAP
jgi:GntR family transcriptional regulator, gluconate operon transcriptional repressor